MSDKLFFYKTTKRNAVCDAVATFLEDCKIYLIKFQKSGIKLELKRCLYKDNCQTQVLACFYLKIGV